MKSEFDRYWAIASAKINLPDTNENAQQWQMLYQVAKSAYRCAKRKYSDNSKSALFLVDCVGE